MDYIHPLWQAEIPQLMPGEERRLPQFNALMPYWDPVVESGYNGQLHNFSTTGTDPEPPNEEEPPLSPPPPRCAGH